MAGKKRRLRRAPIPSPLGSRSNKIKKNKKRNMIDDDEDQGDDIDVSGGFKLEYDDDDSDLPDDFAENAWYVDFFESKNKRKGKNIVSKKKGKRFLARSSLDGSEYLEMENKQEEDESDDTQGMKFLSTHEKELRKMQSKIKQMEKENLGPKIWYMQGEITASKRPKNSLLEVDLDFEHATRPSPVITEEYTASLEAMIKKRIIEGRFDNVQRAPSLINKTPKVRKELDENKSQKGLAVIYEDEYARKTGLIARPLSNCMEKKREVAPYAAILAPEEIFKGKAYTKSEVELTHIDRRRRANKKRSKAETARRFANRARDDTRHEESSTNPRYFHQEGYFWPRRSTVTLIK